MSTPAPNHDVQWKQYVIPPIAAGMAIIPVFYGFVVKSSQQTGTPIPKMTPKEMFMGGAKAAPIIATQVAMQNQLEKGFAKWSGKSSDSMIAMIGCAMMVGFLSSGPLAIFNGLSRGKTPMQSLKVLNAKQVTALVARETSFLFSVKISGPVIEAMKNICGDSKATEYGSAFATGAIASIIGHPADTAFTLWQNEMKVKSISHLMRGAPAKAIAVGCFVVLNQIIKTKMESRS